jgi:hypothetical protein
MIPAIVLAVFVLGPTSFGDAADKVACTFLNPRYAGECVEHVTPASDQTPVQACTVILDCLNNPQCVKTYCRATTIRGGWSLESPKPEARIR